MSIGSFLKTLTLFGITFSLFKSHIYTTGFMKKILLIALVLIYLVGCGISYM